MTQKDFERLQKNCEPHDIFNLGWSIYYTIDFAETFLPKVTLLSGKGVDVYDGAELFKEVVPSQPKVYVIEGSRNIISIIVYTYPKGVLAEQRKSSIELAEHEFCIFFEVDINDKIDVSFMYGKMIRDFLAIKAKELDINTNIQKKYKTNIIKLKYSFNNILNHEQIMFYVFQMLGYKKLSEKPLIIKIENIDILNFSPLGVNNPLKDEENTPTIKFNYSFINQPIKKYTILIIKNNETVYEQNFIEPIIVSGNKKNNDEHIKVRTEKDDNYYMPDEYIFEWNGFNGIDIFSNKEIIGKYTLLLAAIDIENNKHVKEMIFEIEPIRKDTPWIDIVINMREKIIDLSLRVNLTDGGRKGTNLDCYKTGSGTFEPITINCPWDKIPQETLDEINKPIIVYPTKSYEDLKELVVSGLNKYWSRNKTNIGKGITIKDELFEVNTFAIQIDNNEESLNNIPLIYNTNGKWGRSGNTGGDYGDGILVDEILGALPDGTIQQITYNVGYIKYSTGWGYQLEEDEELEFEYTAAHEIGHELLQSFGGTYYSWQHKGSSYLLPQKVKPVAKENADKVTKIDYFKDVNGEKTPDSPKEIDVMKYYNGKSNYYKRIVAAEEDIKGLISLFKYKVKSH